MKFKYKFKPDCILLSGMSCSEFKTMLKRRGYKVPRDFFKIGACATFKNRMYRFRYWNTIGNFVVDISCPLKYFDRWANSTDKTITFYDWNKK